jgi:uncharacterized repeat protein (TIGR03803 family)
MKHRPSVDQIAESDILKSQRRFACADRQPFAAEVLERRMLLSSYTLTNLVTFDGTNGSGPSGLISDAAGNLYGTTCGGGVNGDGTVFELAAGTHALSTLVSFNGTNGSGPSGLIIDAAGNLYGTTESGGASGDGTVFEVAAGTHALSALVSFNGTIEVGNGGLIVDAAGNLYGRTENTVWELAAGTHAFSTLATLNGDLNSLIADAAGNLYGTTQTGGWYASGSVFELAAGTHALSTLVSFDGTNGLRPRTGLIVDAAGNVYGTTDLGATTTAGGTVFEIAVGTHAFQTLVSFNFTNGEHPDALAVDAAGNLYGMTDVGGAGEYGTVFELAARTHAFSTLVSFNATNEEVPPILGLIADAAGNLYGTTQTTVFEVAAGTHALSTLLSFNLPGELPIGGAIADAAGNLYGTTSGGGANDDGTIFEITEVAAASPLTLSTPATSTSVNEGDSYTIDWTGGDSTDTVQLWAEGGPNNSWTELTAGVPESNGSYTWNTTGVDHGWYYFQAWDIPTSGTPYAVQSPNWLHIVVPSASAPNVSLTNPPLATDTVAQGNTYTLNFTASDGSGDTNPIFVQLWVYSGNTGQWTELPNANYLPATQGSYAWDTTGMVPGWYAFAAYATNGDQWSYASSPGWLNITVPTPTFAFTTPTSGQSVAAGGTFNLNWNITGLSSADASNATVQIWAQYLVNGSPVWSEIAASVSASGGTYAWTVPTSPGAGTYYAFSIWLNDGDEWWAQASPNWLQVT